MNIEAVVGGTVVTPAGPVRSDLVIRDGTVHAVGPGPAGAARRLDAAGCYVLPGGVDPHTHLMAAPAPATAAAARGGTTTALSFTSPRAGESDLDALLRGRAELAGGIAIDVGLHAAIYDPGRVTAADLAAARHAGAAAIKIFLAYPELGILCSTARLRELMSLAPGAGLVVAVHCENATLIEALEERAVADGQAGARIFADTRPPEAEDEAVGRVLAAAAQAGATCYLVHLSTAGAMRQVRQARAAGQRGVLAEACVHHLLLDDARYERPDAGRYLVAPPLRAGRHVEALWAALADATIDAVGSDHCQARTLTAGRLAAAGHRYPYGLAGIGPRLPLLLSAAMARGLTMKQVARLAAENPARAFGHYPRKGALAPGSDADAVIFDPAGTTVLPDDGLGDGTGDSVYAGRALRGRIRAVLLRGRLIVADGALVADEPAGTYLAA
ncbi:MAG TPA: amidohydrolase family protein [Streptosporangiaceae bacterium]|nr:amidohydrolase family protein [Streptosporangiaceae bacterium]